MDCQINSEAEINAEKAENLQTFTGIKLLDIKRKVAELASFIGKEGFFYQYTSHNISHIDAMLEILEWLIPQSTKNAMSSADWLLTVLSIYFHDLGMIITREEYDNRDLSGFAEYRDNVLFAGEEGKDYRSKVEQYYHSQDDIERFLYQEFVRENHAKRIGAWILGQAPIRFGYTNNTMMQINNLLTTLKPQIRRDIALICESHHFNDLDDLKKYNVSEPYRGNSKEETANLQYIAILLRTADLLHITSDRTPSISFRLINPTDPISQLEWVKQEAVSSVRPKIAIDQDGLPDTNAISDTIEIFAYYLNQDGFFGLTSYLPWIAEQLDLSFNWVKEANNRYHTFHKFPWRYIDDSHVDSKGFIRGKFGFEIDQKRILNLLTGYTLYNDTNVVVREIVQNSLDAIRLQHYIDSTSEPGKINIHWDSKSRTLSIKDNGTGMTYETIQNHFLKVGVSLYQDEKFQKQHPNFSSISRFGIGVLSTFMIADSVEVTTCHPEEKMIRQISMRSVHGKYLIKSLDKHDDEIARSLGSHGTLIKLKVRKSADKESDDFDILEATQRWIVIPNCEVTVSIDDGLSMNVGFSSPKKAVEDVLPKMGYNASLSSIEVVEKELNGITIAYALVYSSFFREWTFLQAKETSKVLFGICVEGIRVTFDTPGFSGKTIVAIANATGRNAPKTNVARTGLDTTDMDNILKTVYTIYCDQIKQEIEELHEKRHFSKSWAVMEAPYLLHPLLNNDYQRSHHRFLVNSVKKIPLLIAEKNGKRDILTIEKLQEEKCFWESTCPLFDSADQLIREVQSEASLHNLIASLNANYLHLPNEYLLCGFDRFASVRQYLFEDKEVDQIIIYRDQKRADMRWVDQKNPSLWYNLKDVLPYNRRIRLEYDIYISRGDNTHIVGLLDGEVGVLSYDKAFLRYDSELSRYLLSTLREVKNSGENQLIEKTIQIFRVISYLLKRKPGYHEKNISSYINRYIGNMLEYDTENIQDFIQAADSMNFNCFNFRAWERDQIGYYTYDEDY